LSLLRGWSYMIKLVTLMDRGKDSRVGSVLPISQLLRLKVMNKRTAKMRKMSRYPMTCYARSVFLIAVTFETVTRPFGKPLGERTRCERLRRA